MAPNKEVQETAATDLGALLDAGDDAVVILVAGDTRLLAHRAVLAARSPVFEAMFNHDTLEASSGQVTIMDMEGQVLRQMLAYMYTLQTPQMTSMAPQLMKAADKYGLSTLKAACEHQLVTQLEVENAMATAVLAVRHSCPDLTAAAINFIKTYFTLVVGTQGWADAVRNWPEDVVEVSRLLAEPPQEIRSLSREEKGKRLIKAAVDGAVEEMQTLVAAGADVEAMDGCRQTTLHWAADRGHVKAVKFLLRRGAKVDPRDERENTPLHFAAHWGHTAVVRLLAAASADLDARNEDGRTPLHRAAVNGHAQAAAALLEAGADRAARDGNGETPLDLARQNNKLQLVEILT